MRQVDNNYVERHNISIIPRELKDILFHAARYKNKANYIIRNEYHFKHIRRPKNLRTLLLRRLKTTVEYQNVGNSHIARQIIRSLLNDWSTFNTSLTDYYQNPSKYNGRKPRPPGYCRTLTSIILDKNTLGKLRSDGTLTAWHKLFKIKTSRFVSTVRVVPKTHSIIAEVVYIPFTRSKPILDPGLHLNGDLGVNRLIAITSNKPGFIPILVNGGLVKSLNQYFNKTQSYSGGRKYHNGQVRKRYWKIQNLFHHVSKYMIELCLANGIGNIVLGKNDGWKYKVRMNRKNKQNFLYIPFNILIEMIQYKAAAVGINVILVEEAYTSCGSFIDNDPLPKYDKYSEYEWSGSRIKRGLYRSRNGSTIQADINSSYNIGRKAFPKSTYMVLRDRGFAVRPCTVNPLEAPTVLATAHRTKCAG